LSISKPLARRDKELGEEPTQGECQEPWNRGYAEKRASEDSGNDKSKIGYANARSTQRGVGCSSNDAGDGPVPAESPKIGRKLATKTYKRGKKGENSNIKGDKWFVDLKDRWAACAMVDPDWGKSKTKGHDLWYENPPTIDWNKLQGTVMGLNMQGWGEELDRSLLWGMLSRTKTMVAVISDHRLTRPNMNKIDIEMASHWAGA